MAKYKVKITYECNGVTVIEIKELDKLPDVFNSSDERNVYKEVIGYLNEKVGKHFNWKSKENKKLIDGRLAEGYTVDDFKTVIDNKVHSWINEPAQCMYLRPSTLFRKSHFDEYLNEVRVVDKKKLQRQPNYDMDEIKRRAAENTEI